MRIWSWLVYVCSFLGPGKAIHGKVRVDPSRCVHKMGYLRIEEVRPVISYKGIVADLLGPLQGRVLRNSPMTLFGLLQGMCRKLPGGFLGQK